MNSDLGAKEGPGDTGAQLGLFPELQQRDASDRAEVRDRLMRESWERLFGWEGPTVGGFAQVNSCVVPREDGAPLYAYMERVRFVEQRDAHHWIAEIAMGEVRGAPWPKNGIRLVLRESDMWPDIHHSRRIAASA